MLPVTITLRGIPGLKLFRLVHFYFPDNFSAFRISCFVHRTLRCRACVNLTGKANTYLAFLDVRRIDILF